MTVRVAGSRFKCKAHAGESLALSCRSKCSNVLYIGTSLLDDGARDLQGCFLILSVGAHTHPPPPITTSTRGLLLTAANVREHHHVSLAAEEEDVRDKLADDYGRVTAAVPKNGVTVISPAGGCGAESLGTRARRSAPNGCAGGDGEGSLL